MPMEDEKDQLAILRALNIVLLVLASGLAGARMFGWLDVSGVLIVCLIAVAISNWSVARSIGGNKDRTS